MKLIPFADFPLHERDALHAALVRLRIPPHHVCVSRMQPVAGVDDPTLPSVALVSAPGWSHAYEGRDWVARMERDLAEQAAASSTQAEQQDHVDNEGVPSRPAPLGAQ